MKYSTEYLYKIYKAIKYDNKYNILEYFENNL